MALLIADCPRCRVKEMTFDLLGQAYVETFDDWQNLFEVFCVCRGCHKSTVFLVSQKTVNSGKIISQGLNKLEDVVNNIVNVERYISIKDHSAKLPPKYVPENIEKIFQEGAICMATHCYNAAVTMFRLCLDLGTKPLLPKAAAGLNPSTRRNLGARLSWLFEKKKLPENLRDLSTCIKDDGNEGAHEGTLSKADAENTFDFTFSLLERLYTEPKKLEIAKQRRKSRETPKT